MNWRVEHGDCLDLLRAMPDASVDAVVTDPPYGFGAASVSGTNNAKVSRFGDLLNQSFFFREIVVQCRRVCKPDSCMWMFTNWRGLPVVMKGVVEAGEHIESTLVWDKEWIGPGGCVGLRPSYELVVLIPFGKFALPNRGLPDIWRSKWCGHKPSGHPSEKPVHLIAKLITETPGQTILDPFCGSGTTGVACVETGRDFIGCEIDDGYVELARRRIAEAAARPMLEGIK